MVDDGNGGLRPSSQAFQDLGKGMSVGLTCVLDELGEGPLRVVEDFPGYGLIRYGVGWVKSLSLTVERSPTEAEPWHGDVVGKKTGSVRTKFANNSSDRVRWPGQADSP